MVNNQCKNFYATKMKKKKHFCVQRLRNVLLLYYKKTVISELMKEIVCLCGAQSYSMLF